MSLPPVLSSADLPLPELMAARLDGELYPIAEGHCPVDVIQTPAVRLAAALAGRAPRYIAELGTAAWVWGASPVPPPMPELCVELRARARPARPGRAVVREVVLLPFETRRLGRYRVTTPLRTAIDLGRARPTFSADDADVVRRLAEVGGFTLGDCLAAIAERRNLPAKRRAAARLADALGQPPLTRYTS